MPDYECYFKEDRQFRYVDSGVVNPEPLPRSFVLYLVIQVKSRKVQARRILGAERPPLSEKNTQIFGLQRQQDSWVTRGDVIIWYQVSTASKGTIKVNELSC